MTHPSTGVASLAAAFRAGSDDPVRALERALLAAERGKDDKAILCRVPTAPAEAEAAKLRLQRGQPLSPLDGIPVAVASGIAPVALGSDAGGSVRVPAAINGLVGLKPTYGAVPLEGVAGLTLDLDHVGPLAWTVEDATRVFEVIAARAVDRAAVVRGAALLSDFFEGGEPEAMQAARAAAREVFGELPAVPTPFCAWATAVEFIIVGTDAQKTCGPHLRDHAHEIAPDTRMILHLGAGLPAKDRKRADEVRIGMRRELDALLEKYDVLVGPAIGCFAPKIHPDAQAYGELDTAKIAQLAAVSFVTNLTGHPCCVVPCVREGLPMGLQIIGRHGDEARVLAAAGNVERAFGPRRPGRWHG